VVFVSSLGRGKALLQSFVRILAMASSDDVFSGLPNARPQRRSAKRGGGGARSEAKKAPPQARAAASTKPAAARGKPRAKASAEPPKAPSVPPAGYATPTDDDRPRGTDLIGTAVQAAGELAAIGITFGGRALKSAIQRLPRP
jgi:hypothetical protein